MLSRLAAPLLVLGVIACLAAPVSPASAGLARKKPPRTTTICEPLGWAAVTTPLGGRYIVRNDNFAGRPECLGFDPREPSFRVTTSAANSHGSESDAFPDVFYGCTWGLCTDHTVLPAQIRQVQAARTSWSVKARASGRWSAAYDIWFGRHRSAYRAQATGGELMIWLTTHDFPPPPGRKITVDHRRWYIYHWTGKLHGKQWNYVQVRAVHPVSHVTGLRLLPIIRHVEGMGLLRPDWWLLNVEAGFEIWSGGAGLVSKSFSVHVRT